MTTTGALLIGVVVVAVGLAAAKTGRESRVRYIGAAAAAALFGATALSFVYVDCRNADCGVGYTVVGVVWWAGLATLVACFVYGLGRRRRGRQS